MQHALQNFQKMSTLSLKWNYAFDFWFCAFLARNALKRFEQFFTKFSFLLVHHWSPSLSAIIATLEGAKLKINWQLLLLLLLLGFLSPISQEFFSIFTRFWFLKTWWHVLQQGKGKKPNQSWFFSFKKSGSKKLLYYMVQLLKKVWCKIKDVSKIKNLFTQESRKKSLRSNFIHEPE